MKQSFVLRTLFISCFIFTTSATLMAQAGSLDTTFGTGGTTLVNFSFIVPAPDGMAIQSDGKIVSVSGGFSAGHKLVRLNTDGSLDTSFGSDGSVEFSWPMSPGSTTYGKAYDVAIQNVGGQERIVVVGAGNILSGRKAVSALEVERFLPDGSVDTSFGTNGIAVYNAGYTVTVAIQPDGKILTVGDVGDLIRLNIDGSLDMSFGSGGKVVVGGARGLAVDANGGILVGGGKTIGKGSSARNAIAVSRYFPNGVADTSFGSSGIAVADFGVGSQLWDLRIDYTGSVVAGGNSNGLFAAARFTSTGQLDLTFNGTGKATGPAGTGRGTAVQSDGKVVVTGTYNNDFRLVRFSANGSLDSSFGSGGVFTLDVYGNDYSNKTVIQLDPACNCEKIVMSGGSNPYISFARFDTF